MDILVIGGGINRRWDRARRLRAGASGLRFCEQNDLASGTSSASTKLVHGGLRYLEHYAFKLVRAALSEREVLMTAAPHIITPLRFILPHSPGVPARMADPTGIVLVCDHLGTREKLPGSGNLTLTNSDPWRGIEPGTENGLLLLGLLGRR